MAEGKLDRRTASNIIHSLAESGQPPKLGASFLNVGTEQLLEQLRSEYLMEHLTPFEGSDGGGACKWIEADYGNGKTQFLRCTQEQAWELNYATAFVELSQDECPLDRPERVYGAVARSIQAKPLTAADVDRGRGIDVALQQLLDRMFPEVLSGVPNDDLKQQAVEWVSGTLASTPVESSSFAKAASQLLLGKLNGDEPTSQLAAAYLRGDPLVAADLHKLGVYEKLDKSTGFRMLRSMCQLLQRSGLADGTVLLFDEARRSLSLMSSKAQKVACENLLTVINKCNSGDLPGTLFLYAVMPEFFSDFATAYPALQQRCGPGTRINLNTLQNVKELDLLQRIGKRINGIFRTAYPDMPDDEPLIKANLALVAEQVLRRTMGTGTRRLMVKTWVQVLKDARDGGPKPLTPEQVDQVMDGVRQELDAADAERLVAKGE
jgi:hypothetical protein